MIIYDVQQGTPEWLNIRCGIPTASASERIMTPSGKKSTQQEKYRNALLAERCMGHPTIEHITMWQQRGKDLEAQAISFYEFTRDVKTAKVGFITNDQGTVGASPDAFVDEDGGLEIKVPSEAVAMSFLLRSGTAYEEYKAQVQFCLWISGRKWWDLLSWHPDLRPALIRIERDEEFIKALTAHVMDFSGMLEGLASTLVEAGWITDWKHPQNSPIIQMRTV